MTIKAIAAMIVIAQPCHVTGRHPHAIRFRSNQAVKCPFETTRLNELICRSAAFQRTTATRKRCLQEPISYRVIRNHAPDRAALRSRSAISHADDALTEKVSLDPVNPRTVHVGVGALGRWHRISVSPHPHMRKSLFYGRHSTKPLKNAA
jgi:hypothetical protein